jgi:hypothetical protein
MVNLTSCPVFTILLTLGALFFYSSKIALDNHLLFQSNSDVVLDPSVHVINHGISVRKEVKVKNLLKIKEQNIAQLAHTISIKRTIIIKSRQKVILK